MSGQLLQFLGSLAAILALAGLAYWLNLGPAATLHTADQARAIAAESLDGFAATDVGMDEAGRAALLCDSAGRVLLLRQHGTHFASRLLGPFARASIDGDALLIDTAERRFGTARLVLDDPQAWVKRIEAIG